MSYKDKEKQKRYSKEYNKKHYRENKQVYLARTRAAVERNRVWIETFKAKHKCKRCPENHPACLTFHHRSGEKKDGSISKMVADGYSIARIEAEIKKCDILCFNCHMKLHFTRKEQ